MPDLEMTWSGDLAVSPTGDLAVAIEPALGTERVLRRLMTNPGDYVWNPDYGAGLAQFVGRPVELASVEAVIRAQMALEAAVAAIPEPVIGILSDVAGKLYVQIRYADSVTTLASALSVSVPG